MSYLSDQQNVERRVYEQIQAAGWAALSVRTPWIKALHRTVPCRCGHGEASHHNLENCTQDECRCRSYQPAEEETT